MSRVRARRRRGPSALDTETVLAGVVFGLVLVALMSAWAGVHLAVLIDAHTGTAPPSPFGVLTGLEHHTLRWTTAATCCTAAVAIALLAVAAGVVAVLRRAAGRRTGVDAYARHMGQGRAIERLTEAGAARTARRLGVHAGPGLVVGMTIYRVQVLVQGWEDVSVDIWGPRTGKTTSRAVPALLSAPGAALATSNKRDVVDATRGPRAELGPVWVFDPQGIVGESPSWWWNPLSYVTDEVRAKRLADAFAAASREPGDRTDAYFDRAGVWLLAGLLLAAATDRRSIAQVYEWLTNPTDDEPVRLLHGESVTGEVYRQLALKVDGVINLPERQRAGVYGTAEQLASFLINRQALAWATPQSDRTAGGGVGDDQRPQFDPHAFIRSRGTLYSLSREGAGSVGPLVTALTMAVTEAAEDLARRSPGGRLPVPLVAVLDEAANVCRWRDLPDLYSHYGSRGIVLLTILQSWSQGVEVWGRDGMRKLWSAATVKVYGGGVTEVDFLDEISRLIGEVDLDTVSRNDGGRTSSTRSIRRERVLNVDELASMPRGRAVLIASGAPATLIRTLPWMDGPRADEVRASLATYDPGSNAADAAQVRPKSSMSA